MWQLFSSILLGWSLGANDASNVFGTAVASRMIKFTTAVALCSVFVVVGAVLDGSEGIRTYRQLSPMGPNLAFVVSSSAALTVGLMSILRLPVSSSQAVVGALVLLGALNKRLDVHSLTKVLICWVSTPLAATVITVILYFVVGKLVVNLIFPSLFKYDRGLRWLLVLGGSYGAFALGANNVANVTGPFTGPGMLSPLNACLVGSLSIALGVLTYSKNVMLTVGKELVRLEAFSAFIAILGEATTVHIFAKVGVPVSTSQAIIGAVLGIGIIKGTKTINIKLLWKILIGWLGTPALSALVAVSLYSILKWLGMLPAL